MNFPLIANIAVFVILLFVLAQARHKQWSLAKKVLVGLVMGVVFGLALHTIYGADSQVLKDSIQWFNIVGNCCLLPLSQRWWACWSPICSD